MARKRKVVSRRRTTRASRSTRLPMLLAVLAVSTLVSGGVILGSLYQNDLSVLSSNTKRAKAGVVKAGNKGNNNNNKKNNKKNNRAIPTTLTMVVSFVGEPGWLTMGKARIPTTRQVQLLIVDGSGAAARTKNKGGSSTTANLRLNAGTRTYQGSKNIGGLRPGIYTVNISARGFSTYTYQMRVQDNDKNNKKAVRIPAFTLRYTGQTNPNNKSNKNAPVETYETTEFVDPAPVELQ